MKISITKKIAIWYAVVLLVMTVGFSAVIITYSNHQAEKAARSQLIDEVADAVGKIRSIDDHIETTGNISFYDDGVYISFYQTDGDLIEGRIPIQISDPPAFKHESVTFLNSGSDSWYIYDEKHNISGKTIWVRGITKSLFGAGNLNRLLQMFIFIVPAFMVLAILGGALLTRRAFRPIHKMLDTVEEIRTKHDYSERVELEPGKDEIHQLAKNFNMLFDDVEESFNKEKQFNFDVSHELKTPLSVIISQSDYALEHEDYQAEALKKINRESRNMATIVSSMLTLARSDTGNLVLEKSNVDLSELCEIIADQQDFIAEERGIKFITEIEPDISVIGDEVMLIRAIVNLTQNAMKYGTGNGNDTIEFRLKQDSTSAVISVSDHGIGIPEQDLDKIWDRFYRADKARSDDESSGLGLSIVRAIAQAHGGLSEVESEVGSGSTFTIRIPLAGGDNE